MLEDEGEKMEIYKYVCLKMMMKVHKKMLKEKLLKEGVAKHLLLNPRLYLLYMALHNKINNNAHTYIDHVSCAVCSVYA